MGGLARRMPWTSACFLVGAAAIAALPPLNGFASEWLVFQALLGGAAIPDPEVAVLMPLAVGMLALTGGLAAACFVKAFGITFLALPRSKAAADAHEARAPMLAGMAGLALACVVLGLGASIVVPPLVRVGESLAGGPAGAIALVSGVALAPRASIGTYAPLAILALLVAAPVAVLAILRIGGRARGVRIAPTWGCGRVHQTARMEYTAAAFAEPLRRVFAELYRPSEDLSVDFHPESRYVVHGIEYRTRLRRQPEAALYERAVALIRGAAAAVRRLQAGSVHLYLVYLVLALVAFMLAARRWK